MSNSKNVVQNFRARLRRKGYRNISISFIGSVDVAVYDDCVYKHDETHSFYSFKAFDPLGFPVQAEISDAQMANWLERDSVQRGGSIFL